MQDATERVKPTKAQTYNLAMKPIKTAIQKSAAKTAAKPTAKKAAKNTTQPLVVEDDFDSNEATEPRITEPPLTAAERKALKGEAHSLSPVAAIGNQGVTPAIISEVDGQLSAHGLIKIKAMSDDREERTAWLAALCEATGAQPVQQIGKMLVLYREKQAVEEAPKPEGPRHKKWAKNKVPGPKPGSADAQKKVADKKFYYNSFERSIDSDGDAVQRRRVNTGEKPTGRFTRGDKDGAGAYGSPESGRGGRSNRQRADGGASGSTQSRYPPQTAPKGGQTTTRTPRTTTGYSAATTKSRSPISRLTANSRRRKTP